MEKLVDVCIAERELLLEELERLKSSPSVSDADRGAIFRKERQLAGVEAIIARGMTRAPRQSPAKQPHPRAWTTQLNPGGSRL